MPAQNDRAAVLNAARARRGFSRRLGFALVSVLAALMPTGAVAAAAPPAPETGADGQAPALSAWPEVIRRSPYWESQGVYANLATIRRWVLASEGFCSRQARHILFDRRMRFLGYFDDEGPRDANQTRLNEERRRLAEAGTVEAWVPGDQGRIGYPFALSCTQPHARLDDALARYTGTDPSARLWGTWDGMRVGSRSDPVPLHQAIRAVYEDRRERGRISLPEHVLGMLAGKTLIESGGQRNAASRAGALGVMQLSPAALADCRLEAPFRLHRLAQIDCALYVLEQNHRNLAPVFDATFGHLPEGKAELLYRLILVQAYHGGVGRVIELMTGPELNGAAVYFAEHHEPFTAGDIALGLIFHNLGRRDLGFASLYYVTDVHIAMDAACARVDHLPGCG